MEAAEKNRQELEEQNRRMQREKEEESQSLLAIVKDNEGPGYRIERENAVKYCKKQQPFK